MHLIDQQLNLMIRGRFGEAWKLAEEMEKNDPNDPRSKFNRGWFLINQGNLQEGFQCLEHGRGLKVYGSGKINTTKPIWNGTDDLTGKEMTSFFYGENFSMDRVVTYCEKDVKALIDIILNIQTEKSLI